MSAYFLLCNFTDQGVRGIKDVPARRAESLEMAKKHGIEIRAGYLAMGVYDLILQVEAESDEALATFVLSLAAKGNLRTHTVKVFQKDAYDRIIAGIA